MPYSNMPASMQGRMEKCVSDVQGKGKSKQSAIAICYTSLMKGKELGESLKSFSLKAAPHYRATEKASNKASDYLVVEDPKEPSKWHLQVKKDGTPDHTLMGAAWVALHNGYRGNKYEGPNKAEAIAKLKKLYEEEKMPVPSEKSIMDAPNLRGDSIQSCANCKYAMPIVTEDAMMEMASDTMPSVAMMQAKQSGGITLVCTEYEFEADPEWVCDSWEAMPMPVAGDAVGKAVDDAELTDAELWAIDRLYLDVKSGKVVLAPLEETETDKAMVNPPHSGPPGGGTPGGGSPGRTSGKHQKCYMHLKKLGIGDDEARRVCRVALGGPELKAAAIETDASLMVHKQADGHYRWVAFTSSSYKDRDGEIVSQKALEADTERMDSAKEYGWGDWWHTPIRLASCDFSAMQGRLSIESGIFDDDYIGEKMAALAPELAMSRAFYHPANEPDAEGVYHHIQTFRRAFLPRGKESNLLTMLYVSKEEKEMLKDKVEELKKKLGGTKEAEAKVDGLLKVAEETDKAAEQAGLAFKEAATPVPPAPPETPTEEKPISEQPGMFVADMKPEEFDAHLKEATAKAVAELLTPVLAELKAQIAAIGEAQTAATKEANAGVVVQFKTITEAQAALDKRLKELEGLTPRGYRPSQDPDTAISTKKAEGLKPKPDEKHEKDLSKWLAEPAEQMPVPQ